MYQIILKNRLLYLENGINKMQLKIYSNAYTIKIANKNNHKLWFNYSLHLLRQKYVNYQHPSSLKINYYIVNLKKINQPLTNIKAFIPLYVINYNQLLLNIVVIIIYYYNPFQNFYNYVVQSMRKTSVIVHLIYLFMVF